MTLNSGELRSRADFGKPYVLSFNGLRPMKKSASLLLAMFNRYANGVRAECLGGRILAPRFKAKRRSARTPLA